MLVTFEGIEGAGKSTLMSAVAKTLQARGEEPVVAREPGGTPFGDALRAVFLDPGYRVDPIAEVMLLNASRAQLIADVIAPALKTGRTVLCDRFFDATVAYQGYGRGLDVEGLLDICLAATHRIAPDLTLLVDLPVEVSAARVAARGGNDRLEREDDAFHARVRQGYLELAVRFPNRMVVLDGLQAPEALAADALRALERRRAGAPP